MASSLMSRLQLLDAFPKTMEDFRVKTFSGATVTLISFCVASFFVYFELMYFLTPRIEEDLIIDVSRTRDLRINFDVTFPHINCKYLVIDSMDVTGASHVNIIDNVFKTRLDKDTLLPISEREKAVVSGKQAFLNAAVQPTVSTPAPLDPNRCESCFGAESSHRKCCNTCSEVKQAYREKGWAVKDMHTIEQCKREGVHSRGEDLATEGCNIHGYVEVARVGGNLHISPGQTVKEAHHHIHDLSIAADANINLTHHIKHLSFGQELSGIVDIGLLDGTKELDEFFAMNFSYYIKIVSSMLIKLDGDIEKSNKFAVTKHQKRTDDIMSSSGVPGVFFIYEFAPMMVRYTELTNSFPHFITNMLAIVGGIFTSASIVDAVFYHGMNAIKHKMQLGKQT